MKKLLCAIILASSLGVRALPQAVIPAPSKQDSSLMEYYAWRETERCVVVAAGSLHDLTLFSSGLEARNDTKRLSELVRGYDTLLHAHNHIADLSVHARWADQKSVEEALRKYGRTTIEHRLLCEIPSARDVAYVLMIEHPGLLNKSDNSFVIYVTKGSSVTPYYYGLTREVKERFLSLPDDERMPYFTEVLADYQSLLRDYFSAHSKTWDTGGAVEPSGDELRRLIRDQGLIFIEERRGMNAQFPYHFRKFVENGF